MASIPTASDISPSGGLNLDERTALQHFLGKNQTEAEVLFRENPLHYSDDLIWMGLVAFKYYFPCFESYLRSPESEKDTDSLISLIGILECRIDESRSCVDGVEHAIVECLDYCMLNFTKFGVGHTLYGNLESRANRLKALLGE